jgi:hypothetical protein
MVGIRPTRFEPVPSWCIGGFSRDETRSRGSVLLLARIGELCLLFRFEGAGPLGSHPLAWHELRLHCHGVPGERVRTIPAPAMPFENCRASTSIFVF